MPAESAPPSTPTPSADALADAARAPTDAERLRLAESGHDLAPWRIWGPYLSARQWGTVREDYSADGDAWRFFPFDHAHRRAYRWGEDGIAGLCDRYGFLNLAPALWNRRDDRLKERLFGLTNAQGNHGEDAKEFWWHVDATPTHSYAECLYRYPQAAFPYAELLAENARRGRTEPEYELADTGVLDGDRFFDVRVIHAKAAPDDVAVEVRARNCGPEPAPLELLVQLWFRNTWSWGRDARRPALDRLDLDDGAGAFVTRHDWLGRQMLLADGSPRWLRCDNESNLRALFGPDAGPQPAHPKDAIDRAVVHGDESTLAPDGAPATKGACWWRFDAVEPGAEVVVRLRLLKRPDAAARADRSIDSKALLAEVPAIVARRRAEADAFHAATLPPGTDAEAAFIARRAFAGLLWCRKVYRYDVSQWLEGDPAQPPPPAARREREPAGRNTGWRHLALADVISMPDEWEYPWFAAWDLGFHAVALAHVDPWFAKEQLILMCREWAMAPSGQLPAYEWKFSDVNPPVHAWAAWRVYLLDGRRDRSFLVRVFTKLLLNFGWWVNRKDADGSNLFEGGFLGMDNIGPFDRSAPLPPGQRLEQSDATSWMAFFCLGMLTIAIELSRDEPAWDETATKFFEHYLAIAEAMESFGSQRIGLWDDVDGFFYDVLVDAAGGVEPVRVRSMVGLLPLLGVALLPEGLARDMPDFTRRMQWLVERRPELSSSVMHTRFGERQLVTLSVVDPPRLARLLRRVLDESEFLAPNGIRALSATYRGGATVTLRGRDGLTIAYRPAESADGLFGGNSNWRGPVWFPVNVLLSDALRVYAAGVAHDAGVELPAGSGRRVGLADVADEIERRLVALFRVGADGRRPGDPRHVPSGPRWQAHPTFSEYFDGDSGAGVGASHQTGWTAMVAHLICTRGRLAWGATNPRSNE